MQMRLRSVVLLVDPGMCPQRRVEEGDHSFSERWGSVESSRFVVARWSRGEAASMGSAVSSAHMFAGGSWRWRHGGSRAGAKG